MLVGRAGGLEGRIDRLIRAYAGWITQNASLGLMRVADIGVALLADLQLCPALLALTHDVAEPTESKVRARFDGARRTI